MISSCDGSSSPILFALRNSQNMAAAHKASEEDGNYNVTNEAMEGVANDLIDWAALEVIFELHRAVKLGYYRELIDPDPSNIEKRGTGPRACNAAIRCWIVEYLCCNDVLWCNDAMCTQCMYVLYNTCSYVCVQIHVQCDGAYL